MARTLSPLALQTLASLSFLLLPSAVSDRPRSTCSTLCMRTPARELHCLVARARLRSRRYAHTRDATAGVHTLFVLGQAQPCAHGRPLAFQPPSFPLWRLESSGPSNPSATLQQRRNPAATMASAAFRLRAPERHTNKSSLVRSAPIGSR